ncbi:MAG: UvrD-helicase domain-containing protein, partial [Kiritimatiellia bacterium]
MPTIPDFSIWICDPASKSQFFGPHLVSASAGTGKTYNIQNIFARLILDFGMDVSEILIVTFTEAATAELKRRIRDILFDIHSVLSGSTKPQDVSDQVRMLLAATKISIEDKTSPQTKRAIQLIAKALYRMDMASIFTIHAFCRHCLNRYAFETRFPFQIDRISSSEDTLQNLSTDFWFSQVQAPDGKYHHLLQDNKVTLQELQTVFRKVVDHPDCTYDSNLSGILKSVQDSKEDENQINLYIRADTYIKIALELLDQYKQLRSQSADLTFHELLLGMQAALKNNQINQEFLAFLRKEYKAALIDEFQDTDTIQFDIFKRIFLDVKNDAKPPLFFVGDPKQSIYGFRGCNIALYEAIARMEALQNQTYRLTTNYRSTAKLVESVNALFHDDNSNPDNPVFRFGSAQIPYSENVKSLPVEKKPPIGSNSAYRRDATFNVIPVHGERGSFTEVRAACVWQIEYLLKDQNRNRVPSDKPEGRPIRPGDIAVLVRTKTHGRDLYAELTARGIPCILFEYDSVFQSEETNAFLRLLDAIQSPFSVPALSVLLLGPFIQMPPEDVAVLCGNAPKPLLSPAQLLPIAQQYGDGQTLTRNTLQIFLLELKSLLEKRGFMSAWKLFTERTNALQTLVRGATPERTLTNCNQLAELLQKQSGHTSTSPEKLFLWLQEQIAKKENAPDSDESNLRLETDDNALHILTIHKSKGLEFPIVLIPDFWAKTGADSQIDQTVAVTESLDHEPVIEIDQSDKKNTEAEKEDIRLFYVALTRASLAVYYFPCIKANGEPNCKTSIESNLLRWLGMEQVLSMFNPDAAETHFPSIQALKDKPFTVEEARNKATDNPDPAVALLPPPPPSGFPLSNFLETIRTTPLPTWSNEACPIIDSLPPLPQTPVFLVSNSFSSLKPQETNLYALPASSLVVSSPPDNDALNDAAEKSVDHDDDTGLDTIVSPTTHPIFSFAGGTAIGTCWHHIFERISFQTNARSPYNLPIIENTLDAYGQLSQRPQVRA